MRASGAILVFLLASAAWAADPPVPAPDSIAAAKKDIAALKSPVAPDENSSLPAVDMKDLGPVPGSVRPDAAPSADATRDPSLDPSKRKAGTGNWLVDAMDLNTSTKASKGKDKDDILKGDPDLIRADEKGVRMEKDPMAIDDGRDKEVPRENAEKVYNPLDAFMSGWVSARDRELLLTPSSDGPAGAASARSRVDQLPGLEAAPPPPAGDFALSPVDPAAFDDPRAAANPYLAVFDALPVASSRPASLAGSFDLEPAGLQDVARGPSFPGAEAAPPEAQRSVIPDFAQPSDDDKYFKQLKKF
jgi:hypothetical protein